MTSQSQGCTELRNNKPKKNTKKQSHRKPHHKEKSHRDAAESSGCCGFRRQCEAKCDGATMTALRVWGRQRGGCTVVLVDNRLLGTCSKLGTRLQQTVGSREPATAGRRRTAGSWSYEGGECQSCVPPRARSLTSATGCQGARWTPLELGSQKT